MKTLLLLSLILLASCSEDNPKPACEDLRMAYIQAESEYQAILDIKLVMPTLKQSHEWGVAAEAAQEKYNKAKTLFEGCGN